LLPPRDSLAPLVLQKTERHKSSAAFGCGG
jgi:hypothetical protein